jgi:hypothetical protein
LYSGTQARAYTTPPLPDGALAHTALPAYGRLSGLKKRLLRTALDAHKNLKKLYSHCYPTLLHERFH